MPSLVPPSFVFSAAYVGDYDSSSPLTRISNIRTQGTDIQDNTPTKLLPHLGIVAVTGDREVSVEMEFYESISNDLVDRLALGISVSGSFIATPGLKTYSLLLVAPETAEGFSFYFPRLCPEVRYQNKAVKDDGVIIPVTFKLPLNELDTLPYYRGTISELDSPMGSKNPL